MVSYKIPIFDVTYKQYFHSFSPGLFSISAKYNNVVAICTKLIVHDNQRQLQVLPALNNMVVKGAQGVTAISKSSKGFISSFWRVKGSSVAVAAKSKIEGLMKI